MHYDYIIIGGGIVGAATARQLLLQRPGSRCVLIEKEKTAAAHQTGHNSGVIHAGVYYAPGSLKAQFCRRGVSETMRFCRANQIHYEQCGKLLVATNSLELQRMQALYQRCLDNGIEVELLDATALKKREPNVLGLGAIWVSSTGIVDYRQVTQALLREFQQLGGEVRLETEVVGLSEDADAMRVKWRSGSVRETFSADFILACGGLMADRLVRLQGLECDFQIIPYRGEYYRLSAKYNDIVNHLIYPIPDPALPFLGVHLTRMIDGSVTVGPNAVQGYHREGYGRWNFSLHDTAEMLRFKGFWQVLKQHWRTGLQESVDSWWRAGYLKRVQKYCPQLTTADLEPYPAGIRAQAVLTDGTLVHDFLFSESPRSLHVCNAPSPAATSALPISEYLVDKVLARQTA